MPRAGLLQIAAGGGGEDEEIGTANVNRSARALANVLPVVLS